MKIIFQTEFVDFINRSGISKTDKVSSIYNRGDYHPSADFYKEIREEIVNHLQSALSTDDLLNYLEKKKNSKKYNRYLPLIMGYLKFTKRKKVEYFNPKKGIWSHGLLKVKINPEVGLKIGDSHYLLKLYFKESKLGKSEAQIALKMMEESVCTGIYTGYKPAILDVERSKLHYKLSNNPMISTLLKTEAESFLRIWQVLEKLSA